VAQACPELVFLTGPQAGERVVLIKQAMVAGRAAACDVHLKEQYSSRQHLRFEMTADGCVIEILSSRGVIINGKKYRPGKKIILDTGDVLGLGAETRVLFVAGGDDPEAALAAYHEAHPEPEPEHPEPAEAEPEPPGEPEPQPAEQPQPDAPLLTPEEAEAAEQQRQRRAKIRKYAIMGGVYLGILIVILIVLSSMKPPPVGPRGAPLRWSDRAIGEALREPIVRDLNENLAAEELRKALAMFDNRHFRLGNLQKCVRSFKLHLAYLNKPDFDDPDHSAMYQAARDELIERVQADYREGWIRGEAGRWRSATQMWERLRATLPYDKEWNTPGYRGLVDHIMKHASFARQNMPKK